MTLAPERAISGDHPEMVPVLEGDRVIPHDHHATRRIALALEVQKVPSLAGETSPLQKLLTRDFGRGKLHLPPVNENMDGNLGVFHFTISLSMSTPRPPFGVGLPWGGGPA